MPKRKLLAERTPVVQPPDESYRLIGLTRNLITKVDTEDYEWLCKWDWYAMYSQTAKSFYAIRSEYVGKEHFFFLMHRQIMRCQKRKQVDHRNHDTLDNRKFNLRPCSSSQNHCNRLMNTNNTSGFRGVHFDKDRNKWVAWIAMNCRDKYLGRFYSPEEAARAYDAAAKALHGEFASLNFPDS